MLDLAPYGTPIMTTSLDSLNASLDWIRKSPKHIGEVKLIVCRPGVGERKQLAKARLDTVFGLEGDNWYQRGNKKMPDGKANPDMQLNLMNARVIEAIAESEERWSLAGDQFYVDLDLSKRNLPPGTRLQIGSAVIEVTAEPHLGCKKFMDRFGKDAVSFVNSDAGKALNLRGVNARVVQHGDVTQFCEIRKLA